MIRANVIWSRFAPSPTSKKKPKGFDGKNPAAYPAGVVRDARLASSPARRRAACEVLLTATGPIPAWASQVQGLGRDAADLQARPQALRRVRPCSGHALPDRQEVVDLERAEPALVADRRSTRRRARRRSRSSAYMYRQLADVGDRRPARAPATARDQIWLGETAPLGDDPSGCSAQRSLRVAEEVRDRRSSRPRRRRSCAASSASTPRARS